MIVKGVLVKFMSWMMVLMLLMSTNLYPTTGQNIPTKLPSKSTNIVPVYIVAQHAHNTMRGVKDDACEHCLRCAHACQAACACNFCHIHYAVLSMSRVVLTTGYRPVVFSVSSDFYISYISSPLFRPPILV